MVIIGLWTKRNASSDKLLDDEIEAYSKDNLLEA